MGAAVGVARRAPTRSRRAPWCRCWTGRRPRRTPPCVTPTLSLAEAVTFTVPLTVAPLGGAVIDVVGGVVSGAPAPDREDEVVAVVVGARAARGRAARCSGRPLAPPGWRRRWAGCSWRRASGAGRGRSHGADERPGRARGVGRVVEVEVVRRERRCRPRPWRDRHRLARREVAAVGGRRPSAGRSTRRSGTCPTCRRRTSC